MEILFEDRLILAESQSEVLLQLTSDSLIIRHRVRHVTIERHRRTRSFEFSIKGGRDTGKRCISLSSNFTRDSLGLPVVISRVGSLENSSIRVGDAILSVNNENISQWTHQQVIAALRDPLANQVQLTVRYLNDIAGYLSITSSKCRSSLPVTLTHLLAKEYLPGRPVSGLLRDVRRSNEDPSVVGRYPLLYAYVSEQVTDNKQTTFRVHPLQSPPTGLLISEDAVQQQRWISRLNLVIRHLIHRRLTELNQIFLPHEQILYANWIHQDRSWKSLFLVFKDNLLYLFDGSRPFTLCPEDFLSCPRVYPILEISIQPTRSSSSSHALMLTLLHPSTSECRPIDFHRRTDYDEFLSNYHRAVYLSVYSVRCRSFDCLYQGELCRLLISVQQGLQLSHLETNHSVWMFTWQELQSSSDNGRETIFFRFRRSSLVDIQIQSFPAEETSSCSQVVFICQISLVIRSGKFFGINVFLARFFRPKELRKPTRI